MLAGGVETHRNGEGGIRSKADPAARQIGSGKWGYIEVKASMGDVEAHPAP